MAPPLDPPQIFSLWKPTQTSKLKFSLLQGSCRSALPSVLCSKLRRGFCPWWCHFLSLWVFWVHELSQANNSVDFLTCFDSHWSNRRRGIFVFCYLNFGQNNPSHENATKYIQQMFYVLDIITTVPWTPLFHNAIKRTEESWRYQIKGRVNKCRSEHCSFSVLTTI